VSDLIEASTEAAARSASRSLAGDFSAEIQRLRDQLVTLRMLVEATLDFPEEEIDFLQKADARGQLARIVEQLDAVLARPARARCCARASRSSSRGSPTWQELAAQRAGRRRARDRDADPGHDARQGERDDPDRGRAGCT
jgi:hypothetical protein